jgi:hypothetical protein
MISYGSMWKKWQCVKNLSRYRKRVFVCLRDFWGCSVKTEAVCNHVLNLPLKSYVQITEI